MVELIAEPVAAALAPPSGAPFANGDLVLVYDFGGGTFDAALVRIGDFRFEPDVLGHRSLEDCGGRDIDAAVNEWLRKHGPRELRAVLEADSTDATKALAALRSRLEFASMATLMKHQLSEAPVAVEIFSPLGLELSLDAGVLAKLAEPFVTRTVACCVELLTVAQVQAANLAAVLMVGGGSWMPAVADAVAAELKRPVRTARDPELAVLQGAARFAAQAAERFAVPSPQGEEDRPLRWTIPGETATFLRWLVLVGDHYQEGQALAEVRLAAGAILRLCDQDSGVVRGQHVRPGALISSGDWLVTTGVPRPWRVALGSPPTGSPAPADGAICAGSQNGKVFALSIGTGNSRWSLASRSEGAAQVVAAGSAVYVSKESAVLYALDPANGQVRWRQKVATSKLRCAPAAAAGLVCVWAESGTLFAVSGDDGSVFWQQDIGAPGQGFLTLSDGTLYAVIEGSSVLRALDAADGATRWDFPLSSPVPPAATQSATTTRRRARTAPGAAVNPSARSATTPRSNAAAPPSPLRPSGPPWAAHGAVYLGSSTSLLAVSAVTGKQRWRASIPCATGPVTAAGLVFAGGPDGTLSALDPESGAIRWQQRVSRSAITALTATGDMIYATSAAAAGPSGATAAAGTQGSQVQAVRAADGAVAWRWSASGTFTRALVSDGMLFVGSSDGSVYAIDALTGKGPKNSRSTATTT